MHANRINEDAGSRLLVISDIHGYAEGFQRLLQSAKYNPSKDRLVLLGDYIEVGIPSTWKTLDIIRDHQRMGAYTIAGNHELKLASRKNRGRLRLSKSRGYSAWISTLPLFLLADGYLFVHAGLRPGVPFHRQSVKDLTEIRQDFYLQPTHKFGKSLSVNGASAKRIVFGHTPTFKFGAPPGTIWTDGLRIGIDTGAKHGMRLTLADLSNGIAYSCATRPGFRCSDYKQTPIYIRN